MSGFATRMASAVVMFAIFFAAMYFKKVGLHVLWYFCQGAIFYELCTDIRTQIPQMSPFLYWVGFAGIFAFM